MSLGNSIRNGTRWLVTGSAGMQVVNFVFGIVLARLLAPEDFGAIVTIQIFTGVAGFIATGGTGEALIQGKNVSERDYHVVFSIQLAVGLLLFSTMFLLAWWVGYWFDNPLYTTLMHVSVLTFLWRPFANLPTVRLRRAMRFKALAIIRLLVLLTSSLVSISLAVADMGPWSLVFGGLAGSFANITMLNLLVHERYRLAFDIATARRFGSYGFRFVSVDILDYVFMQTGNFIISQFANATSVGLFNKADSMAKIPVVAIGGSVYQPVFRALAQEQDDTNKSRYIYHRTITLLSVYMLPLYIFLWWLSAPLIEFLYGAKWLEAAEPMRILALTGLLLCFGQPSGALIAARNKLQKEVKVQAISCLLLAGLGTTGMHYYGITGVAWAIVLSEVFRSSILAYIASAALGLGITPVFVSLRPGILLNGLLFAVLFITHDLLGPTGIHQSNPALYLFAMGTIGGISYLIGFLFLPLRELETEAGRWKQRFRASLPFLP